MGKYYSPITNTELIKLENGYYKSNDDMFYYRRVNGNIVALVDSNNGGPLIPNGDGTFTSLYSGNNNFHLINGEIVEFKDPNNGGPLIPNGDGTFTSLYSSEKFHFDSSKNIFIPLYIEMPELCDEEALVKGNYMIGINSGEKYIVKENAHIEGEYLVGDTTGRRFLISEKGIVIPDEYQNYHFDYSGDSTRYIPIKQDIGVELLKQYEQEENSRVDAICESIITEGALENGIDLALVKYLTYIKANMDKIDSTDVELLIQIMNGVKIDSSILVNRLESLKKEEEKSK